MEHTQRPYKESQETILDLEAEYRLDQRRVLRTQWAFWENQYDGSAYWGWGFANEMLPSRSHRGTTNWKWYLAIDACILNVFS